MEIRDSDAQMWIEAWRQQVIEKAVRRADEIILSDLGDLENM